MAFIVVAGIAVAAVAGIAGLLVALFAYLCFGTKIWEKGKRSDAAAVPQVPPTDGSIKFCTQCGQSAAAAMVFCGKCGAKFEPLAPMQAAPIAPDASAGAPSGQSAKVNAIVPAYVFSNYVL